ncbi:MAG: hypothetical protein WA947_17115 [Phormidesmis sp.]
MNIKLIRRALLFVLLAGTIGAVQKAGITKKEGNFTTSLADERQTNMELKKIMLLKNSPSLGFGSTIADWSFLQFLQYFGDGEARRVDGYSHNPDYLATVLKHDPYYRDFYLFLSESTTFYSGMPTKTVALMEEGLSQMKENRASDSYYIWRYKGNNELLFLGDSKAAQRSFEMAAKWAGTSHDKNSDLMAQLSKQTATFLASDPDSKRAQIDSWSSILTTTFSDEARDRAIKRIEELGGGVIFAKDGRIEVQYEKSEAESNTSKNSNI